MTGGVSDAAHDDVAGTATDPAEYRAAPSSEYEKASVRVTFARRRYWHQPFESVVDHVSMPPEPGGSAECDHVTMRLAGALGLS